MRNRGIAEIVVIIIGVAIIGIITTVIFLTKSTAPQPTTIKPPTQTREEEISYTPQDPSVMNIFTPLDGETTSANPLKITGYLPSNAVLKIFSGKAEYSKSHSKGDFSISFQLRPGLNNISVTAEYENKIKDAAQINILYIPDNLISK